MSQLNDTIKQVISRQTLFSFATADSQGNINLIPIKFVFIENNTTLWIVDNFMEKTRHNLLDNPKAALNVIDPQIECAVQIKGRIQIETEGLRYTAMHQQVLSLQPSAPAKALLVMSIDTIYDCWPGKTIGQQLP